MNEGGLDALSISSEEETRWMTEANCQNTDAESFFPVKGQNVPSAVLETCARCSVKNECLMYAVKYNMDGIWGGTSEFQRSKIRNKMFRENREFYYEHMRAKKRKTRDF